MRFVTIKHDNFRVAPCPTGRLWGNRSAGAFTLTEIVIVILIIGLLSAILITAGRTMRSSVHQRATRTILVKLKAIASEYHVVTEGYVDDNDMSVFIATVKKITTINTMLGSMGTLHYDGAPLYDGVTVYDTWKNEIRYARTNNHANGDIDLPQHLYPFFASAGPDGDFGDVQNDDAASQDNIYSFEIE